MAEISLWAPVMSGFESIWALVQNPTIEAVACAIGLLVPLQVLWELNRASRTLGGDSASLPGHRVKLNRGRRLPPIASPGHGT